MILLRRFSQIIFLGIFIYFLLITVDPYSPVNPFFVTNPLLAITAMLASRTVVLVLTFSLIIIIATILMGRFFCGWLCPLGTLLDMFHKILPFKPLLDKKIWWLKKVKYLLLVFLLSATILGINLAGWFDPIIITFKFFALALYPALNTLIKNVIIDQWGWTALERPLENILLLDRNEILFQDAAPFIVIFLVIMGLTFLQRRSWCRNLCPLGALLGLFSFKRLLRLKIGSDCTECGKCVQTCKMATINEQITLYDKECIQCYACLPVCPVNTISCNFKKSPLPAPAPELPAPVRLPERRSFLMASLLGVFSVPLLQNNLARHKSDRSTIVLRPPGAIRSEEKFLGQCVRCGECMKICPTNGLQPLMLQRGLYGMWSPSLIPKIGGCLYNCNLCTQVCPTEALQPLPLPQKKKWLLGTALIDEKKCFKCGTCEEYCPIPEKAIKVEYDDFGDRALRYYVVPELCIGCGICENVCPYPKDIKQPRAIRVFPSKNPV